jgi:hypothetical protein
MMAANLGARSMRLLIGGMATGAALAVLTMSSGSGAPTLLATSLPFLLAALTGVAKTTTA